MEMAKVTSKGQITIPVSIRRRLNINEGDKLLFIDSPDGVIMVNPDMLQSGQYEHARHEKVQLQQDVVAEPRQNYSSDIEPAQNLNATMATETYTAIETPSVPETPSIPETPSVSETPSAPASPLISETSPISEAAPSPVAGVSDEKKPAPQVQGLDLQSLLSEIRSIGRNI